MDDATRTVGFIGCGTLSEAVITAIRNGGGKQPILVSPRSEATSRRLAAEVPGVERVESNAEVVARADIVVLAMRPQQLDEALAGLRFSAGQLVVSFVAKLGLMELKHRAAPARQVCRVTPLPMIAMGKGPVVLYPRLDAVARLFEGNGLVIAAASEDEMMAFGYASSLMSTYFQFQNTVVDWLESRGVAPGTASDYVASMGEGLAATGMATAVADRAALPERHETKAGLNERCRQTLMATGWFGELAAMLNRLEQASLRSSE
jgi:pyrroline-5-carboxylate reductase